jgi:hypothetical protein
MRLDEVLAQKDNLLIPETYGYHPPPDLNITRMPEEVAKSDEEHCFAIMLLNGGPLAVYEDLLLFAGIHGAVYSGQ